MKNVVIKVDGMSCGGCVSNVDKILKAQAGVVRAEVSLSEGLAKVSYDPVKVSAEVLCQAIEDAGFAATIS